MDYYQFFSKIYQVAAKKMCRDCQQVINKKSKILDLGCGSGIIGKEFKDYFQADLIGVDIKDQRIVNIPFQLFDGLHLPFLENSFDSVLISFVLHHAQDPIGLLKEAKRVTRNKIIVYEDLPGKGLGNIICKIHAISFSRFFQKNKEGGIFFTAQELKKIFDDLKLKLILEKGVSFPLNPVKKKLFVLEKI